MRHVIRLGHACGHLVKTSYSMLASGIPNCLSTVLNYYFRTFFFIFDYLSYFSSTQYILKFTKITKYFKNFTIKYFQTLLYVIIKL